MTAMKAPRRWPLAFIAAPAAVAVWSGWVGLGGMCGFGLVQPFPGIVPWHLNTAITLPVGVESYGAYALGAWLTPGTSGPARKFARRSAIGSLSLGVVGQVAYHLLVAAHATRAPWPVVVLVSCLPVVTLGFGAALTHLLRVPVAPEQADETAHEAEPESAPEAGVEASVPSVPVAPDDADEIAQDPGTEDPWEPAAEPEFPEASLLAVPVPTDAERAAEIAMRAAVHVGNPFTVNQLSQRFNLTRTAATRVRARVLADSAQEQPGAPAEDQPAA